MYLLHPSLRKLTLIAVLLVLVSLACGLGDETPSQDPVPEDLAIDEIAQPESESVEEEVVPVEVIEELVEEEIRLAFEVLSDGLFLFSEALATNDAAKMDEAFALLAQITTPETVTIMKEHARLQYSDLLFIAGDPLDDLHTCVDHQPVENGFPFIDTNILLGGILPDGDVGISRLSAFDAEVEGMDAENYVIDYGLHHLLRIPFFEPSKSGLEQPAQWHYELTNETFSINLKNVIFSDGERFLTFQGVANGEWVSTPTSLQSTFDNGIWQMRFDPLALDADTLFYFTSNSLDTNNPDNPDSECQYDDSLLNKLGEPVLKLAPFLNALEDR